LIENAMKIVITGAAGLIGQNLIPRFKAQGLQNIVGIDKHPSNTKTLRRLHPDIQIIEEDLAVPGTWTEALKGCDVLIHNHAQIGALDVEPFNRNNVVASRNVLDAAKHHRLPYMVHVSSSVVNSIAHDFYTETKKQQERLAVESGIPCCILRPTLMFGWFDRKHLGWLARFMKQSPIFPVPGDGNYLRQPLFAGDFCDVIISATMTQRPGEIHNISGMEKVPYIELIRAVRKATDSNSKIVKLPYGLFKFLLQAYAIIDRNPPFTPKQLEALVTPDVFEVIDWPTIFGVRATPLHIALEETFRHPVYSKIVLDF
jgi:nucleoside-diphosphate-sugar epimerase